MKEMTRQRLARLILEELSDKIKGNEGLGRKLEAFTDLPVEKVADAILKQFEYLLTSDLRELIIHLIEQEVAADQPGELSARQQEISSPEVNAESSDTGKSVAVSQEENAVPLVEGSSGHIMEHFADREPFPTESLQLEFKPEDWFYMLAFSYAPNSSGKGIPSLQLQFKGVGESSNVFLFDYGDVRFYMSMLTIEEYTCTKLGEPTLTAKQTTRFKYEHEHLLNTLRTQEVLVGLPFWTIIKGRENIIRMVEDRYVVLLRTLIDVHDASDWDVEVLVFDDHISHLPSITENLKSRPYQRETRRSSDKGIDVKLLERVIFREKSIAQEIHSQLLLQSTRSKIDYMIRLDSAFMEDWKSILSARYNLGKEKRKLFCQTIAKIEQEYKEYELMLRVSSPSVRFSLLS